MQNHFRDKTLPARTPGGPTRDKTLPARPKTPILAHFPDAGRILSRSGCKQTTQGELCTAFGACAGTKLSRHTGLTRSTGTKLSRHTGLTRSTGTKLSPLARNSPFRRVLPEQGELFHARAANRPRRENFVPHAEPLPGQNSPSTYPRRAHPVQNSPGIRASRAQPVQNSPRTPQNADFGPLSGCWANFVTLGLQTDHAGRTLYRIRGLCRYKTLPARTPGGPTRDKTLPARPKAPIAAHFPHAGRVLYRFHHQQAEQGEESHAPAPRLTPPTHPPPIPHAIRLHEISTTPRNVAIPTITFQISKYSQGNCMRNY